MELSKIEIITSSSKLTKLQTSLGKVGVTGITVMQAIGCGVQNGTFEYVPEQNVDMELLPKTYIMLVVENHLVEKAVETIKKELYTGHIGDGKIFISPITNVIRVRTGEEGLDALV